MSRSEFEATKQVVLNRLMKSANSKNDTEIEISAAIHEVWPKFIDAQAMNFFERIDARMQHAVSALQFSTDSFYYAKNYARAGWRRLHWPDGILVACEFKASKYRNAMLGIRCLVESSKLNSPFRKISIAIHQELTKEADRSEFLCIGPPNPREWWPYDGVVSEMDDLGSPNTLQLLNGHPFKGRTFENIFYDDAFRLIEVVDDVLAKNEQ